MRHDRRRNTRSFLEEKKEIGLCRYLMVGKVPDKIMVMGGVLACSECTIIIMEPALVPIRIWHHSAGSSFTTHEITVACQPMIFTWFPSCHKTTYSFLRSFTNYFQELTTNVPAIEKYSICNSAQSVESFFREIN